MHGDLDTPDSRRRGDHMLRVRGAATPARCAQQLANKQPCERTMLLLLGAVVALMSLCTAYNNGLGATPQVRSPAFMLPSAYAALALHAR
jgi:hypothetical protein